MVSDKPETSSEVVSETTETIWLKSDVVLDTEAIELANEPTVLLSAEVVASMDDKELEKPPTVVTAFAT